MSCIFCDIVEKKKPSEILDEDAVSVVFKDIRPSAPIHLLIVPKKHISSIQNIQEADKELLGVLIIKARNIAKAKDMQGYKLLFNVGRLGGQLVEHIHLHLLGGWGSPPEEIIYESR